MSSGGGKGSKGGMRPGRHCVGGSMWKDEKYGILTVARSWRIGVCIADQQLYINVRSKADK